MKNKTIEIPDELFEREIFRQLDSSKLEHQKYIGVSILTAEEDKSLDASYEKISIASKKIKGIDDVFEKGYFTKEEQDEIARENYGLIDKCVSEFSPMNVEQKGKFNADDIRDVCHEAFANALNNYPRYESTAKFTSFAYVYMSNACRDFLKKMNSKKVGVSVSLNESAGGKGEGDDNTLEDVLAGEDDIGYDLVERQMVFTSFIESVFDGMDRGDVIILMYLYGIGDAEYEHSELEIANLVNVPERVIHRLIEKAQSNFKLVLYERGLVTEAEDILKNYLDFSEKRIQKALKDAKERYLNSMSNVNIVI